MVPRRAHGGLFRWRTVMKDEEDSFHLPHGARDLTGRTHGCRRVLHNFQNLPEISRPKRRVTTNPWGARMAKETDPFSVRSICRTQSMFTCRRRLNLKVFKACHRTTQRTSRRVPGQPCLAFIGASMQMARRLTGDAPTEIKRQARLYCGADWRAKSHPYDPGSILKWIWTSYPKAEPGLTHQRRHRCLSLAACK